MYTNNPFELDAFHEGRMLERDRVLTEVMGDYEVAERESANPERYVSESDYFAGHEDIDLYDSLAQFDGNYVDPYEIEEALTVPHTMGETDAVLWCDTHAKFTPHYWGDLMGGKSNPFLFCLDCDSDKVE